MKFPCHACGAHYVIADEKIRSPGVKVRCKKCGELIVLRRSKDGQVTIQNKSPARPSSEPVTQRSAPPPPPRDSEDIATLAIAVSSESSVGSGSLPPYALNSLNPEDTKHWDVHTGDAQPDSEATMAEGAGLPSIPNVTSFSPGALNDQSLNAAGSPADDDQGERVLTQPGRALGSRAGLSDNAVEARTVIDVVSPDVRDPLMTRVVEVPIPDDARRVDTQRGDVADGLVSPSAALTDAQMPAPMSWADEGAKVDRAFFDDAQAAAQDDPERAAQPEGPAFPPLDLGTKLTENRRDVRASTSGVAVGGSFGVAETEQLASTIGAEIGFDPNMLAYAANTGGTYRSTGARAVSGAAEQGGSVDEIGSAFDAVFGPGAGLASPEPERELFDTIVGSKIPDEVRENSGLVRATSQKNGSSNDERIAGADAKDPSRAWIPPAAAGSEAKEEPMEWYVAIRDAEVGPLTLTDLRQRWDAREIDASSLAWKAGMADWQAIRFVKELEVLASLGGTPMAIPSGETTNEGLRTRGSGGRTSEPPSATVQTFMPLDPGTEPARGHVDPAVVSEPSWKPSAADALRMLAQAEVADGQARAETIFDKDTSVPSTLRFGASEQTATRNLRALPKSADLGSSVPLHDPIASRTSYPSWLVPAAIGAGTLVVVLVILMAYSLLRQPAPTPTPTSASMPSSVAALAPPSGQGTGSGQPAADTKVKQDAPSVAALPTATATVARAEATTPTKPVPQPVPSAVTTPPSAANNAPAAQSHSRRTTGRQPAGRSQGEVRSQPTSPSPTPASRAQSDRPEADDLLREADSRRRGQDRPARDNDLPDQLDETQVLRTLRKYKDDINSCRERQTKADPNLEGVMTVNLVVLNGGQTSKPSVSPEKFRGSVVAKCVVEAVRGWRFPAFSGHPQPIDFPVMVRGR